MQFSATVCTVLPVLLHQTIYNRSRQIRVRLQKIDDINNFQNARRAFPPPEVVAYKSGNHYSDRSSARILRVYI